MTGLPADPPPAATPARRFGPLVVLGVFTVCLIRLAGFVHANAVDLPFNDQWDALGPLFENRGPWSAFFMQHGPPRLGLGGLINWYLYAATDWDVRAEAWFGVAVLVMTTLVALALAARLRGHVAWSDAAFPLLLLSPVHWESFIHIPFVGAHLLPLLLTLLLAYSWIAERPLSRVLGVGLFGAATLFTGYGICGVPATAGLAILLWVRAEQKTPPVPRWPAALILLTLAAATALFAFHYHWSPGTKEWHFPVAAVWDYPRFCALMFTSLLGWRAITAESTVVGVLLLGLVAAACLVAFAMIWRRRATARARAVWILTGTSLTFAALTAIGRLPTTIEAAFLWRYTTLMMPALCGLALAAEGWAEARAPRWRHVCGLLWFTLAGVVWSNFTPEIYAATIAKGKRLWIASYLQTHDLRAANRAADFVIYFPEPDSPRIAEKLRWLEAHRLSFFRPSPDKQ